MSNIFQYLPLNDWKNVRLTCKLWSDCATIIPMTRKIKFVFRENPSIPENLGELLQNSSFAQFDFEFHYLCTDYIPNELWEKIGRNINSVKFNECNVDGYTLLKIIEKCPNLGSINIIGDCDQFNGYGHYNLSHIIKCLSFCVDKHVINSKLHTFSIFLERTVSNANVFRKIFTVFPNLEHFNCSILDYSFNDKEELFEVDSSIQLKSLILKPRKHSDTGALWMEKPLLPIQQFRLTTFETTFPYVQWTESKKEFLFQFFTAQKDLQVISFNVGSIDFTKELIFHILKKCQNLSRFIVICNDSTINLKCEEIAEFLKLVANLQCLAITGEFKYDSLPKESSLKLALEVLLLNKASQSQHTEFYKYLLKHCPNNKHIGVTLPCDSILQDIIRTMPNLKTLTLHTNSTHKISAEGFFKKEEFSIQQLQELEHLEITHHLGVVINGIEDIASMFHFPHLKFLKLDFRAEQVPFKQLYHIVSNMPELESLNLRLYKLETLRQTVELCKCFKNLKCLSVKNLMFLPQDRRNSSLKPLFKMLPSLRYLSIYSHEEVFSYNPVEKMLLRSSKRDFKGYSFSRNESIFKKFNINIHFSQI